MTIQERIEKLKQAQELISDVLDDMDKEKEKGEIYDKLQEGYRQTHKAYLGFKRLRSLQPLGVK